MCALCGREADELHVSQAAGGVVCCERCHVRAAPPASPAAQRYRYRPPRAKRREPSAYERLFERVYRALQAAGVARHGSEWGVFGLGDPQLPLMGYCPVCGAGTVAIRLLNTDPPRLRTAGCSSGCSPDLISDVVVDEIVKTL